MISAGAKHLLDSLSEAKDEPKVLTGNVDELGIRREDAERYIKELIANGIAHPYPSSRMLGEYAFINLIQK